jgi:hypothetical protein
MKRGSGGAFSGGERKEEGVRYGGGRHIEGKEGGGAGTTCSWAVMAGRWQDAGAAQAVPGRHGTGEGVRRR